MTLGVLTIAGLAAIERFRPKWPAPLVAVAVGIGGVAWLGWEQKGIELVGTIPAGLPALSLPLLSVSGQVWPGALGMALMRSGDRLIDVPY